MEYSLKLVAESDRYFAYFQITGRPVHLRVAMHLYRRALSARRRGL